MEISVYLPTFFMGDSLAWLLSVQLTIRCGKAITHYTANPNLSKHKKWLQLQS